MRNTEEAAYVLARMAAAGRGAWAADLQRALDTGTPPGTRVVRAVAKRAAAALASGGMACPLPDVELRLAARTGLLGAYLGELGAAEAALEAARAAGLSPRGAGEAATSLLLAPPPDTPAMAGVWGALLGDRQPGSAAARGWGTGGRTRAWERLLACSAGDAAAMRALLGPGGGPQRGANDAPARRATAEAAARLLPATERRALLGARAGTAGARDGLAWALAESLPRGTLRDLALRRAAERPDTAPKTEQPLAWAALAGPGVPWNGGARPLPGERRAGGATPASRGRCARWLASRPAPAWAAALDLAWEAGRARPGVWRLIASGDGCPTGRHEAAWALAVHGRDEDAALVAATILATAGAAGADTRQEVLRAASIAREAESRGAALGAARAALQLAARDARHQVREDAVAHLGPWLPEETVPLAAAQLWREAGKEAARFLVRHAPDLASIGALRAAGLGPPPGADTPGRKRAATDALAAAWARILGG